MNPEMTESNNDCTSFSRAAIVSRPSPSGYLSSILKSLKVPTHNVSPDPLVDEEEINTISFDQLVQMVHSENVALLLDSEYAYSFVDDRLRDTQAQRLGALCRDKIEFRQALSSLFPGFSYKGLKLSDEKDPPYSSEEMTFPFIMKPRRGYLNANVFKVIDYDHFRKVWQEAKMIQKSDAAKAYYGLIDFENYIIEDYIDGDEYAVQGFYDDQCQPVIISIVKRTFATQERNWTTLFYTSRKLHQEIYPIAYELIGSVGKILGAKRLPYNFEFRINSKGQAIPIESNLLRFSIDLLDELSSYSFNISLYEYFFNQIKPDWDRLYKTTDDAYYCVFVGVIPNHVNPYKVTGVKEDDLRKQFDGFIKFHNKLHTKLLMGNVMYRCTDIDNIQSIVDMNLDQFLIMKS